MTTEDTLAIIARELDEWLSTILNPSKKERVILTRLQKQAWLIGEYTYPRPVVRQLSDDSYHSKSSDEDLTEPFTVIHL